MQMDRRQFLGLSAGLLGGTTLPLRFAWAAADAEGWRHGSALIGEPRLPADFAHFDYVNPAAPKGGRVRLASNGETFDTLNPILPKGVAGDGLGLVYESLGIASLNEEDISGQYGLLADALRFPDDFSAVTYRLRPEARWQDGTPVTAEDVVWSFDKAKALNPSTAFYYQHVMKAEITGEREITFTFDVTGNRELPHIVGQLTILPKHWWEGKDAEGKPRNIGESTLELPMGSGPYKITRIDAGRSIQLTRDDKYWAKDLPIGLGMNNFDEITYEYFGDDEVKFEAFKADKVDYREENQAKRWATGYDIPAVQDGRIIKEMQAPEQVSGTMVGFIPNLRRPMFQDVRVRRALNHVFDFEELNRTIFFGQYQRISSFFYGIPLASSGLPDAGELALLEPLRDQIPPEVFTTPYANPVGGDPGKARENLRTAVNLFKDAGYTLDNNRMIGPDGKPFAFELMLSSPILERVALPYQGWLKRIGVEMTVRSVDSNQFTARVRSRDFDMVYSGWGQSNSPGNEQLDYWGSKAADVEDSRNYAGIRNPAIDSLIQSLILAKDRDALVTAVHALDRVLLSEQYVIPSYTILTDRLAYWNRFSHAEKLPRFSVGFPTVWWWDEAKAKATGGGN